MIPTQLFDDDARLAAAFPAADQWVLAHGQCGALANESQPPIRELSTIAWVSSP